MPTKPITPSEAQKLKPRKIPPPLVFEAVNELIVENLDTHGRSTFTLDAAYRRIRKKGLRTRQAEYEHWLDIEPYYREAGWKVTFTDTGWNSSLPDTFTFEIDR